MEYGPADNLSLTYVSFEIFLVKIRHVLPAIYPWTTLSLNIMISVALSRGGRVGSCIEPLITQSNWTQWNQIIKEALGCSNQGIKFLPK